MAASTYTTNGRHSSQDLSHVEFRKRARHISIACESDLIKAKGYIDKALASRQEIDTNINIGNAIVLLKRHRGMKHSS